TDSEPQLVELAEILPRYCSRTEKCAALGIQLHNEIIRADGKADLAVPCYTLAIHVARRVEQETACVRVRVAASRGGWERPPFFAVKHRELAIRGSMCSRSIAMTGVFIQVRKKTDGEARMDWKR